MNRKVQVQWAEEDETQMDLGAIVICREVKQHVTPELLRKLILEHRKSWPEPPDIGTAVTVLEPRRGLCVELETEVGRVTVVRMAEREGGAA